MMYPFMQLDDDTEVVHSGMAPDGEHVDVYFEKPIEGGFESAWCTLPEYKWRDVEGFSKADIDRYDEFLRSTAHLIIRFARQGGLGHASNF